MLRWKLLSSKLPEKLLSAYPLFQKYLYQNLKSPLKEYSKFKLSSFSSRDIQSRIDHLQSLLNKITGYEKCLVHKDLVLIQSANYVKVKDELKASKVAYDKNVEERAHVQREIASILQRKGYWGDTEVLQFADLHRLELKLEQNVATSKAALKLMEDKIEAAHDSLMESIRNRYQEEQLWSDKIRLTSTYGTLGLMLIQVILFLSLHLYFEPRKRSLMIQNLNATWEKNQLLLIGSLNETIERKLNESLSSKDQQQLPVLPIQQETSNNEQFKDKVLVDENFLMGAIAASSFMIPFLSIFHYFNKD